MSQNERLIYLIDYLLKERDINLTMPSDHDDLFQLYRALVNVREASPISKEFIEIQDQMLQVDAIVNAANNQMEGCFIPGHHCIDNAIHTYAGVQLRNECHDFMLKQHHLEPTGTAKITKAYNLPSRYILHTVGPIVNDRVTKKDEQLLASCYESCLKLAEDYHLKSIAFCCISTGVFHFPNDLVAKIAVETVQNYLKHSSIEHVIFNVFKDDDEHLYKALLNQ